MATWRDLITKEMTLAGESWADVVSMTLTQAQLDTEFNDGLGCPEGIPFALWTHDRVYFPGQTEGAEYVGSASRNPDGKPIQHVGF